MVTSVVEKRLGALPVAAEFLRRLDVAGTFDRLCPGRDIAHLTHGQVIEALVANRLTAPPPLWRVDRWAGEWAWTREADRRHKRLMAAGVHRILVAQRLLPDSPAAAMACCTAFLAADAVTQEAFRSDADGAIELLHQLKAMLRAFLEQQPG